MVRKRGFSWIAAKLRRANPFIGSLSITAAALLFALELPEDTGRWSASSILLMAVLASAALWGFWRGLFAGVIAALCYDYFFIPPIFTLNIDEWQDALSLLIFCLAAAAVSALAESLNRRTLEARRDKIFARRLYALSQRIRTAEDIKAIAAEVAASAGAVLGAKVLLLLPGDGGLKIVATHPSSLTLSDTEMASVIRDCAKALQKPGESAQEEHQTCVALPMDSTDGNAAFLTVGPIKRRTWQQPYRVQLIGTLAERASSALRTAALSKRAEEARIAAEAEKLRSALLTSISHDLKAPLAVILGSASSLNELGSRLSGEAAQELLEMIETEGERLNQYITHLLDMSRVESDAVRPRRQPTDLGDVVGSALIRTKALLSGHRIVTRLPDDIPWLELDPVLMEKALCNILENAAHYTPSGTEISLTVSIAPHSVTMQVADEGQGIESRDLPYIFEKFYRGGLGASKPKGTGLGLSITRGFLQAMGASVTASARQDRSGTVFTIELPLSPTQ